ncbi:hypothetical protein [Rhodomicrobium lacus]|uniref:hypothetical protein n=1 Tax=Rhodomicrobium lacus TaxID=2498452 RepID=UPI0026E3405D|nr:hypothetical protein [Rhodomicrobium lacus]WKW50428.1 hypothetical protein QMO75_14255 [Rhodomicrobium lacus]
MGGPESSDDDYSREGVLEMEVALDVMHAYRGWILRELADATRVGDLERAALLVSKSREANALKMRLYRGDEEARIRCIAEYGPLVSVKGANE